jgi:hypothetical protein
VKKRRIINDPVYGFITVRSELIYNIINHPWFQRLRHIRQLGLTDLVFPGAIHTRFQHALGAMHLMGTAIDSLRSKNVEISTEEEEAAQLAILLHDIGHGPFSHALEESLLQQVEHESLSYVIIRELNREFNGALELCMKIFRNSYRRKFLHQLVSSQLDMDRLDYLRRDAFFTGVEEGSIGVDRIISMLTVHNDELVVLAKGIYGVEHFLNARRFMYWQVYLHKTTLSAERMVINLIRRAQYLVQHGESLPATASLLHFLRKTRTIDDFHQKETLHCFGSLDDADIWGSMKLWQQSRDKILSLLSSQLLQRKLFQIRLSAAPVQKQAVEKLRSALAEEFRILRAEASYLFSSGSVTNAAYAEGQHIHVLMPDGEKADIAQASDLPTIKALTKIVRKNYLCWPKNVSL